MIVSNWPLILGLVIALAAGIALMFFGARRFQTPTDRELRQRRLQQDATDPLKRWAQSVFLMVSRDCDYGHIPAWEARRMLRRWWDVHGPQDLEQTLTELEQMHHLEPAWPLVRFIVVARLGVGAGYLDDADSWSRIWPVADRLREAYPDWRAMANAYVVSRRQWRGIAIDGSEDDDETRWILDNIAQLHDGRWQQTSFRWEHASR
jgi:hypothetical protein